MGPGYSEWGCSGRRIGSFARACLSSFQWSPGLFVAGLAACLRSRQRRVGVCDMRANLKWLAAGACGRVFRVGDNIDRVDAVFARVEGEDGVWLAVEITDDAGIAVDLGQADIQIFGEQPWKAPNAPRATLSTPRMRLVAAMALPPPSECRTTSLASRATRPSMSPLLVALKKRSSRSLFLRCEVLKRGRMAPTCCLARLRIWRQLVSLG